jgi:amino acid transporter
MAPEHESSDVAGVTTFDDESAVAELANTTPYGLLTAYVHTRDYARPLRIAERLDRSHRDVPALVNLSIEGDLDLDALISRRRPLGQATDALDGLKTGHALRMLLIVKDSCPTIVLEPKTQGEVTMPARPANELTHGEGLAARSLNGIEVLAQSVAQIAPSSFIAFGPAAMVAVAGYGAWLSFIIASAAVLAIAFCINVFARRRASVGSLYALSRLSFRPGGSYVTGWSMIVGVITITGGSLAAAGFFASELGGSIGIGSLDKPGWQVVLDIVLLAVALLITITSVQRAAIVSAALEVVSVIFLIVIFVAVYLKTGRIFDSRQFSFNGVSLKGIFEAIVLAIFGFIGFESAAALGEEARDPGRAVPRAIWRSVVLAAIIFTFATYTQILGFTSSSALAANPDPVGHLASLVGLSFLRGFVYLGFTASAFAVVVACLNVASRVLFGMAREGIAPMALGRAHPRYQTPYVTLLLVAPIALIPCVVLVGNGSAPLSVTAWLGEIGVYGYMLCYALICIGAVVFTRRIAGMTRNGALVLFSAILGVVALAYTFYQQLFPAPPFPLNILPYVYLGCLAIGLIWYGYIYIRNPAAARRAGTYADDLEPNTGAESTPPVAGARNDRV